MHTTCGIARRSYVNKGNIGATTATEAAKGQIVVVAAVQEHATPTWQPGVGLGVGVGGWGTVISRISPIIITAG